MKRTISIEVGKGSQAHNSRKFKASNVDAERTQNNVCYCNENIRSALFQEFTVVFQKSTVHQLLRSSPCKFHFAGYY
jgi:hypothetical protein